MKNIESFFHWDRQEGPIDSLEKVANQVEIDHQGRFWKMVVLKILDY